MAGGHWAAAEGRCAVAVAVRPYRPGLRATPLPLEGTTMSQGIEPPFSYSGHRDASTSAPSDVPTSDAAVGINSVEGRSAADTPEGQDHPPEAGGHDRAAAVAKDPPVDLAALDAAGDPSERAERAHACAQDCGKVEQGARAQMSAAIGQRLAIILAYGEDKHDAGLVRREVEARGLIRNPGD
jgi:hypothetical protein